MTREEMLSHGERFLEAWNTQDVEAVVSFYSEDVSYRDPNTKGDVRGADAMRRYLTKLFSIWTMHWSLREVYPLKETDGAAVLWHATFKRAGETQTVEADGMDLVLYNGEKVKRNDVYFDRAVFAALFGMPAPAGKG